MSSDSCPSCNRQFSKCGQCHHCMQEPRKRVIEKMKDEERQVKLNNVLKVVHNFLSAHGRDPLELDAKIVIAYSKDLKFLEQNLSKEVV